MMCVALSRGNEGGREGPMMCLSALIIRHYCCWGGACWYRKDGCNYLFLLGMGR